MFCGIFFKDCMHISPKAAISTLTLLIKDQIYKLPLGSAWDYLLLRYMRTGLGRKSWRGGLVNILWIFSHGFNPIPNQCYPFFMYHFSTGFGHKNAWVNGFHSEYKNRLIRFAGYDIE